MKILIVEDEIITATDLKKTLEKNGHTVTSICKTYNETLEAFAQTIPDLVLIDIKLRLSTKNGIEIAEELKKNHDLPIVFLTSQTDHNTFENAKSIQPAAYLFKPFRHEEVSFQVELAHSHYLVNRPQSQNPYTSESVFFPYQGGLKKLNKKDILYIKADGAYVNIFLINYPKPILLTMNIGYISQFFTTPNFYKLTRSYIVNMDYIDYLDNDILYLERSEIGIPIPQAQKQAFIQRIAIIRTPRNK